MHGPPIPVLWLCGPSGVGKTAVGWEIYTQRIGEGIETAYVDIDQLGMCYPEPGSDPGRYRMKERNARAVVRNFRAFGAACVVISGVVDPQRGVSADGFVDASLTVCKLTARADALTERFLARGTRLDQVDGLVEEAALIDASTPADLVVGTDGRSVADIAARVREQAGGRPSIDGVTPTPALPDDDAADDTGGGVLWICGATGVGKSTVGFAVYQKILRTGRTAAYVDVDQLGFTGPRAADHRLKARNLADVWRTYRDAGAEVLIAVGPADAASAVVYEDALPSSAITWCRLHAGPQRLTERIVLRGNGRGSWPQPGDPLKDRPRAELLAIADAAAAEAAALERASFGVLIDTDALDVGDAADAVLHATGWPHDRSA